MTLKDCLEDLQANNLKGCGVARTLRTLDKDDSDALQQALDNENISSAKLSAVLKNNGLKVSSRTIARHRNKGSDRDSCQCP